MSTTRLDRPALLGLLVVAMSISIAACTGSAAPSASAPPSDAPTAGPSASPDDPVTGPTDPGSPPPGAVDGGDLVIPHPGTVNPHPVAVEGIEANVDAGHVTARLTWTSGVEPCYVLDSVLMSRDGANIDLTVVEGSGDPNAVCIEIAKTKSTIVDIGELEPGTYTITATNSQIPPVTITVT
jgi:hypothetical protein